ncbi:hypothetical protein [Nocardioides sp. Leaf285]|uniref:hypothetical protein n=1 Tax=Nocardioides sp. Leaf285 TaxID=1736322 RepID=UPI00070351BC|nr:hypothetical protein [Nocardioides sp. Leaf285]KQP63136.1 hypothetical protein ASF47_19190 [Nocardioides sp. Leaf285]
MTYPSPSLTAAQAARQQARHGDGTYAAFARSEADLHDLDLAVDPATGLGDDGSVTEPSEVEEQRNTYVFESWKTDKAIASIEKANRRAERAGIAERFGYRTETFEERRVEERTGVETIVEMTRLHLDRPTVQHEGWEFAATLSWDDEVGLVTRSVPGAELDHRPTDRTCDVCGQNRERRDTYVVSRTDPETGKRTQMQVGSNCLTRFMGIKPAGLWMLEFDVEESENAAPPATGRNRVEQRYDSTQVMAIALAAVEDDGWVSRSAARAYYEASNGEATKTATADIVGSALFGDHRTKEARAERDRILARASQIRESGEAEALLAEARALDGDSDYAENLRTIASGQSVTSRNIGTLISAIGARHARQQRAERDTAQAEATANSRHLGRPGERLADVKVTVTETRFFPNDYSGRTLISMQDTDGNVIKWWATGSGPEDIAEGGTYLMKATVKEHGSFRDIAETTVLRAKMEPVEE